MRRRRNWLQLAHFGAVGACGYVVNLAVFITLVRRAALSYQLAAACSFALAATGNYTCNRLWTFRRRRGSVATQGPRFLVVSLVALAANILVLHALVGLGMEKLAAQAMAITLVTPVSFLGNKLWTFAPPDERARRDVGAIVPLLALAGALAAGYVFYAFPLSLSPARAAAPSARLIGRLELWAMLAHWRLLVPDTRAETAVAAIAVVLVAFALYGAALALAWRSGNARRSPLVAALAASATFFAIAVLSLPTINTDAYNYIATGRVAAFHHANPYTVAPARFPADSVYRYAGHKYTSTPGDNKLGAWTLITMALAHVGGHDVVTSLLLYRLVFMAFNLANLALIVVLARRLQPRLQLAGVVAYGWNPIVVIGGQTKVDTVMVFFLLAGALALARAHRRTAVLCLGLSVLVKLITLPLLVAYLLRHARRRRWRQLTGDLALLAAVTLAVYAPFVGAPDLVAREAALVFGGSSAPSALRPLLGGGFLALIVVVAVSRDRSLPALVRGWALIALYSGAFLTHFGFSWYLMVLIALGAIAAEARVLIAAAGLSVGAFLLNTLDTTGAATADMPPRAAVCLVPAVICGLGWALAARRRSAGTRAGASADRRVRADRGGIPWLVIPTYNEAQNIESAVRRAVAALAAVAPAGFRILIVDDDSPDGTGHIAERLAGELPAVSVLHRRQRQGLGPAYLAGFRRALQCGAGYVLQMDADGSHDPDDLARLLRAVRDGGADVALGSRYAPGGRTVGWPWRRRALSRAGCWYARSVLGVPIHDLTGGFKCFAADALGALDLATVRCRGYAFQVELSYRAARGGWRIEEVPITFCDRRLGASKMTWRIALEAAWVIPQLRLPPVPPTPTVHSDRLVGALP